MAELAEKYLRVYSLEEINTLPLFSFRGKIHIIRTAEETEKAVEELSSCGLLGFDTETRPSFKRGVRYAPALVQLASENEVYIFQLTEYPLEEKLASLLASPCIIKSGVSVSEDVRDLRRVHEFTPQMFLDLGQVSQKCGMQTHGLRNLAANLLGVRISKSVRCSNWGKKDLSEQQIQYAATDAWVSREIHKAMYKLNII